MTFIQLKAIVERTGAKHAELLVIARERKLAHRRVGPDVLFEAEAAEALVAAWKTDHAPYRLTRPRKARFAAPVG